MTIKIAEYCFADRIMPSLEVEDKRQFLEQVSRFIAGVLSLPSYYIEEALTQRERLCSTAFGKGVAVPHASLKNLTEPAVFFIKTLEPIDFEGLDGEAVDLFFVLLTPENAGADHLRLLAMASRLLRDSQVRLQLRGGKTSESLHAILTGQDFQKKVG